MSVPDPFSFEFQDMGTSVILRDGTEHVNISEHFFSTTKHLNTTFQDDTSDPLNQLHSTDDTDDMNLVYSQIEQGLTINSEEDIFEKRTVPPLLYAPNDNEALHSPTYTSFEIEQVSVLDSLNATLHFEDFETVQSFSEYTCSICENMFGIDIHESPMLTEPSGTYAMKNLQLTIKAH